MLRRSIDILVAIVVLVLLGPLFIVLAAAIVWDSPGSPLYPGWRAGRHGVPFRMWKFRTMIRGAEQRGAAITCRNDSRITRVGALLRRTKLDELPQFLNVLLGDMTLIGPRPEAPEFVALYSDIERAVLCVTPGITGRVQVESASEANGIPKDGSSDYYVRQVMPGKLHRDLEYLRTRTAWTDVQVLLSTVVLVLRSLASK